MLDEKLLFCSCMIFMHRVVATRSADSINKGVPIIVTSECILRAFVKINALYLIV